MSIELENNSSQGEAAFGSYGSAAFLVTVPALAKPQAHVSLRNLGSAGYWYVKFKRASGPTTSVYSVRLGPSEFVTIDNPPIGDIWLLAGAGVNGNLSWDLGWYQ